jgi:hypothetical protein
MKLALGAIAPVLALSLLVGLSVCEMQMHVDSKPMSSGPPVTAVAPKRQVADVSAYGISEICYDGVVYLITPTGNVGGAKIDKTRLGPIQCSTK